MYLLSFLILSLATVLLPAEAIPTQLHPRSKPYYCTPSTRFALGYQICTFASLIDPSFNTYLWLFDSQCGIVGSATDLTPSLLPASAGSGSHVYNFNSHLRYVAVTDLKDGQSPVVLKYAGKTWGGKKEQCWRDDNQVSFAAALRLSMSSTSRVCGANTIYFSGGSAALSSTARPQRLWASRHCQENVARRRCSWALYHSVMERKESWA